ncbi:unnamed protein product, partial [Brassica napus]
MVRSEEELHVMLNVRGGNGRFSENERAILNERGDNGRCWMWRDDRERVMPGGDMRVRAMLIGERRELRETVILRGEKVDDAVSLLALVYATIVSHDGRAITIDGHRRVLLSGSIHYPGSTPEMWRNLIKRGKEGGLDAIETYMNDCMAFLRIGPYACAEWNYGGFPVCLHNMPGMVFRTTNKAYDAKLHNYDSRHGNVMGSYGESGKEYIKWCANMAQSLDVGVPWIMCQQNDAPQPMLNTCNGFYCDNFVPNNPNTPKMLTENWTGWFKQWGGKNPHRTTEDVAFSFARFFQRGGTFNNYYMSHGGTSFDRTACGPYITTSYDYDVPLDEYGNLNQPKYGHLKQLHDVLHSMERALTYETSPPLTLETLHRQQFIKPKKDQADFLEMEMKIQMQQLVSKENITLSRLGLLPFYWIAKMRLITPPR